MLVAANAAMAWETEGRRLEEDRLRSGTSALLEFPTHGFYLVAEMPHDQSGLVVGQLLVTYEWSDWRNANFWWLQSVYVHPEWRRCGVFRRLYQFVVDEVRARSDVCGIRLYVEQDNTIAQAVYEKMDFSSTSYLIFEDDFVLPRK